jgi:serine/threonine protein phosphatase PrpC
LGPAANRSADLLVVGAMLSDIGLVRSINEDAVTFAVPSASADPENRSGLLLVADGMGGHAAGEVASALAAEVVRRCFFELNGAVPDILSTAFAVANKTIFDYGQGHPECAGMGTTCTALAIRSDKIWLGHVGDSRAYLLRNGELRQLSEDQTLVAQMVREGTMTPIEARTSKHNNIIMQALGTEPEVDPDIWEDGLLLSAGDALVLCTDGLHGLVDDGIIAEVAGRYSPAEACQELIRRALQAGGHDNVSVGIFHAIAG